MTRLSQSVAAIVGGLTLSLGLAGCMNERPAGLSASAVMAVEGDKTLSYMAQNDGTVTVFDTQANTVIYAGQMIKGQSLLVDVPNDRVTLDGKVVSQNDLHGGDVNRIFFEPKDHMETTVQTDTNTMETSHN